MNSPGSSRVSGSSRGFTLLEVMVALTIFGLLISAATGALQLGNRSWETGLVQSSQTLESRVSMDFLRSHLAQMIPLAREEDNRTLVYFEGRHDQMIFVAPTPQQRHGDAMTEFLLSIEHTMDGIDLVLYYQAYRPGAQSFNVSLDSDSLVLAHGFSAADFSYFGKSTPMAGDHRWHSQWDKRADELPLQVRLTTEFADVRRQWPELIFNVPARVM